MDHPDEGHSHLEIKLHLLVDVFQRVGRREDLHREHGRALEICGVRLPGGDFGRDVGDVDADRAVGVRLSRNPASPETTSPRGLGWVSSQISRIVTMRLSVRLCRRFRLVMGFSRNCPRISSRSTPSSGRASISSVVIGSVEMTVLTSRTPLAAWILRLASPAKSIGSAARASCWSGSQA